jgi:hypothetical protein
MVEPAFERVAVAGRREHAPNDPMEFDCQEM